MVWLDFRFSLVGVGELLSFFFSFSFIHIFSLSARIFAVRIRAKVELTKVRLQRLHQMTEDEAKAEGSKLTEKHLTYLSHFAKKWNNKYYMQGQWYRFESAPLVWVLEFKLIDTLLIKPADIEEDIESVLHLQDIC